MTQPLDLAHSEERQRLLARLVIAASAGLAFLPQFVQIFTAGRGSTLVAQTSAQTGATATAGYAILALLGVVSVYAITSQAGRASGRRHASLVLALLPWVATILLSLGHGDRAAPGWLAYPLAVTALWFVGARVADAAVLAPMTSLVAVGGIALGVFRPELGILVEVSEKALVGDSLLAGPFGHSNTFGVVLAFGGLTFLLWKRSGLTRLVWFVPVLFALLWASSRTALLALGIAAAALIVVFIGKHGRRARSLLVSIAGLIAVVWVPLATVDPTAFTSRGRIWIGSVQYVTQQDGWVFGLGPSFYLNVAQYRNTLGGDAFHGHNLFVTSFTTGGVFLVAVMGFAVLFAAAAAARAADAGFIYPTTFVVLLLTVSLFETPLSFRDPGAMFAVATIPFALVLLTARMPEQDSRDTKVTSRTHGTASR